MCVVEGRLEPKILIVAPEDLISKPDLVKQRMEGSDKKGPPSRWLGA